MTDNQFMQLMEEMRRQTHVLEQILMELKHPHEQTTKHLPEPKVFKIPKAK